MSAEEGAAVADREVRATMYWLIHIVVPPGDTQQQMQADVNIGGVTLSNLWDYLQWALTAEEKGRWMFLQYIWKTRECFPIGRHSRL